MGTKPNKTTKKQRVPEVPPALKSTGARAYGLLREQILSLALSPGSDIDEAQIASDLGLSRTPVREALIRLTSEGLVVLTPNRGARVAPLDLDQVPQLLEALELYERATTRWAVLRRTDEHLKELERRNEAFERATKTGDVRMIVEANWAFHETINKACGNRYLARDCSAALRSVMRLSILAFSEGESAPEMQADVVVQHQDMIEAIRRRDVAKADALVHRHAEIFREKVRNFVGGRSTFDFALTHEAKPAK